MTGSPERMAETERRLATVESLQQTIELMKQELIAYRETLNRKLSVLQQPAPAPPKPAAPKSSATPARGTPLARKPDAEPKPTVRGTTRRPATDPQVTPPPPSRGPQRKVEAAPPAPPAASDKPEDLRAAPRRKGNPVPVLLSNSNGTSEPLQGWVLDRSTGGLRILVDQAIPAGSRLSVRPAKAHGSFPWIQIEVRSCQPERSSWNLGVQFVEKPSWGEMQMFG